MSRRSNQHLPFTNTLFRNPPSSVSRPSTFTRRSDARTGSDQRARPQRRGTRRASALASAQTHGRSWVPQQAIAQQGIGDLDLQPIPRATPKPIPKPAPNSLDLGNDARGAEEAVEWGQLLGVACVLVTFLAAAVFL